MIQDSDDNFFAFFKIIIFTPEVALDPPPTRLPRRPAAVAAAAPKNFDFRKMKKMCLCLLLSRENF